jgi:hypothetical protein
MIPTFQLGGMGRGGGLSLEARMRQLFAGGVPGVMLDWVNASNLYQDTARTTIVATNGDPIGSVTDLSGNGNNASQATSTKRGLWNAAGYGATDGADDGWQTPAIDFSVTDAVTIVAAIRKRSDASAGIVCELGNSWSNVGRFGLAAPQSAGANIGFGTRGDGTFSGAAYFNAAVAAPALVVVTGIGRISTDTSILRINGVQRATGASDQGAGTYSNLPLNIGFRNGTSVFASLDYYRLAAIGRELTAGELTNIAEAWANQPVGVI